MIEIEVKADDRQPRAALDRLLRRGAIGPDMDAGLAVLDRDPPTCPEDEIKDVAAARVVLAGCGVTRSPVPP